MKIEFFLRFKTVVGQSLFVSGNHPLLGDNKTAAAFPLTYLNQEFWYAALEFDSVETSLQYHYIFQNEHGELIKEGENSRLLEIKKSSPNVVVVDSWNDESFYENVFYTAPFEQVFFRENKKAKFKSKDSFTHAFKVKAPLTASTEAVCIIGSISALGNWNTSSPVLMQKKGDWWTAEISLSNHELPASYKYGLVHAETNQFIRYESGDNRTVFNDELPDKKTIIHDAFVRLPDSTWKGAGIAIPVFSLRTENSFGIGEFLDIKCLADWAKETGLKLIQLLPVNDTSATFTSKDSYPYAAISAFALHPVYINLAKVAGKKFSQTIKALAKKQKSLNALPEIDYDQVIGFKMNVLRELYEMDGGSFLQASDYQIFYEDNKNWLVPYAAFCFYRDKFNTADFSKWKMATEYNEEEIKRLGSSKNKSFQQISFFYFVQYHLHLQLKEAVDYAHKKGLAIKGDIPIGIYRYGADAWTAPQLYNMNLQAGAPPDDFAVKGQNWGFPTYNWQKMEEENFEWWKSRFHQMSNYFDAFRIDHILGFFRIWSIPMDAVEGILGRFFPAVPFLYPSSSKEGLCLTEIVFVSP
jgi:4-alpha-glucanotransferase